MIESATVWWKERINSLHGVYPLKGFILDESAVRSFMFAVMECSEIAFFNFLSVY